MIVDNFNATSMQDSFLSVILKYRCQILFTTRSRLDGHSCMLLEEISDKTTLLQLAGKFFSDTEEKSDVIEQIIEAVPCPYARCRTGITLTGNRNIGTRNALKKIVGRKCRS